MPYNSISAAKKGSFPTTASGAAMTLAQINDLASMYDAIESAGGADNPMAVAWKQWKRKYKKVGNKWIQRETKEEANVKTKAELNEQALTINFQEQQIWRETESDEAKSERIRKALRALQTDPLNPVYFYIAGVFSDVVVVNVSDGEYYAYGYEDDGETVTLGDPQPVERAFIPADIQAEAAATQEQVSKTLNEKKDVKEVMLVELCEQKQTLELIESEGKKPRIRGKAMLTNAISENGTYYDRDTVIKPAIPKALAEGITGLIGHPLKDAKGNFIPPTFSEIGVKYDKLWFEEGDDWLHYEGEIVETSKGKDLLACARSGIPIRNSIRGEPLGGVEIVEASGNRQQCKKVKPGYEFKSIDLILEDPAFPGSEATSFEEQKKQQEEDVDEIKKLQEQVAALTKQLEEGKKNQLTVEQLAEAKKLLNEAKKQDKIKGILETKEVQDELGGFVEVARRHLNQIALAEDVEKVWPSVKETIVEMKKGKAEPKGTGRVEILGEGEIKVPHSPQEAFAYLTEITDKSPLFKRFQETKHIPRSSPNWMANPKLVIEQLVKNYVLDKSKGGSLFENSRRNPLKVLCEAVGDNETYTGDIATSGAALLPLMLPVYERLIMNEVCSVQPLDRPSGAAFFKKQYYEDTGGDPTLHAAVDYDYADKAEDSGGAQITTSILTSAITLKTPKKLNFPWTVEAEKSLLAYHGINMNAMVIQDGRDEISREINAYVLYLMLTATSLANSDNAVVAANVDFDATPEPGWKYDEWLRFKLPEAIAQAGASMFGYRYVKPNFAICDENAAVYFTMLNGYGAGEPQNFGIGIQRMGTYQQLMKIYEAAGFTANKILLGYKGPGILDAGFGFFPFVLAELLDMVTDPATYEKVQPMWSWYAAEKLIGYLFATVTIIPAV